MADLVHYKKNNLSTIENDGKKIYNDNNFYRSLANIMEHPEFRTFINSYVNDVYDLNVILKFMKLYDMIEKKDSTLNGYHKLSILKNFIDNSNIRYKIFHQTDKLIL
jgi:hypothetical protein